MDLDQFLQFLNDVPRGHCSCVITADGRIYACPDGHLNALLDLDEGRDMLSTIPGDVSPLFFMLEKTCAVAVDYESQVYCGEISKAQAPILATLEQRGRILHRPKNVKGHIAL